MWRAGADLKVGTTSAANGWRGEWMAAKRTACEVDADLADLKVGTTHGQALVLDASRKSATSMSRRRMAVDILLASR